MISFLLINMIITEQIINDIFNQELNNHFNHYFSFCFQITITKRTYLCTQKYYMSMIIVSINLQPIQLDSNEQ